MDHEVGSDQEQGGESEAEKQIGHLTGKRSETEVKIEAKRRKGITNKLNRPNLCRVLRSASVKSAALHEIDARAAGSR